MNDIESILVYSYCYKREQGENMRGLPKTESFIKKLGSFGGVSVFVVQMLLLATISITSINPSVNAETSYTSTPF